MPISWSSSSGFIIYYSLIGQVPHVVRKPFIARYEREQYGIRSRDLAKIGQIAYPPRYLKGLDIEILWYQFGTISKKKPGRCRDLSVFLPLTYI